MSLQLYMDVHVRRAVSRGLRLRGVDVLTAQEDSAERLADPALLARATQLGRVLVSQDADLLEEAARRQQTGEHFAGVIYGHQQQVTVGQMVRDLEIYAKVYDPADMVDQVKYLPL